MSIYIEKKTLILKLSKFAVIFFCNDVPFRETGHELVRKRNFFRILLTAEEILAEIEEDDFMTSAIVFIQTLAMVFIQ